MRLRREVYSNVIEHFIAVTRTHLGVVQSVEYWDSVTWKLGLSLGPGRQLSLARFSEPIVANLV
jgi:hypothetical protein